MKSLDIKYVFFIWIALYNQTMHTTDQDCTGNKFNRLIQSFHEREQESGRLQSIMKKLPQAIDATIAIFTAAYVTLKKIIPEKKSYNLERDVLEDSYKKMVYTSIREIEYLLIASSQSSDKTLQIQAILQLYTVSVPAWYKQKFHEALTALFPLYFNHKGEFYYPTQQPNFKKIFKKYLKKTPTDWAELAAINEKWYKDEPCCLQENPFITLIDNKYNQAIVATITSIQQGDILTAKQIYLLYPNSTAIAIIYQQALDEILTNHCNEFGIFVHAYHDPIWNSLDVEEKQAYAKNKELNELLILRHQRANQLTQRLFDCAEKETIRSLSAWQRNHFFDHIYKMLPLEINTLCDDTYFSECK